MRRLNELCGAPSCSEGCLFFSDDLFRLWLQSVQYDLQHDFAWVTDEVYCSVEAIIEATEELESIGAMIRYLLG